MNFSKISIITFIVISAVLINLGLQPTESYATPECSEWSEIVCEQLGAMSVVCGKMGVDLHTSGIVSDQTPLKKLGFDFGEGPYRADATRIDTGRYRVSLQSMSRPNDRQTKEVALKTKADTVYPVNLPPAPKGKYTWNSAIQHDLIEQLGLGPYFEHKEEPRSFVDLRIVDAEKIAAYGFTDNRENDSEYQMSYIGNDRWELRSTKNQQSAVFVYKNAKWTVESNVKNPSSMEPPVSNQASAFPSPTLTNEAAIASDQKESSTPVDTIEEEVTAQPEEKTAQAGLLLFVNSDFENGDLTNWIATGDAFAFQPTKGDNPTARRRNQPSNHQGEYWIGTYEKFTGAAEMQPGEIQGDQPIGTLTSIPFKITGERIHFLVGGGRRIDKTYVALIINGEEVLTAAGENHETMRREVWDVSAYQGQEAQIRIIDDHFGGWGHINADDFRYQSE